MKPLPPCVFPSMTEEEVVTIPGEESGTAYRLRVEAGLHGYLRIEQLGYNATLGWYVQKSFCLPGQVVHQLMPHLRQAVAMIPRSASAERLLGGSLSDENCGPLRFPGPQVNDSASRDELRKEA